MTRPGLFNTKARYGTVAQILHWATAILILILLPMGNFMHDLPISTSEEIADKVWLYSLHKTLGMTVLIIAVLRVMWAFFSTHPVPLHPERKVESFAAATVHWMLYISIILVPIVGYVHHAATTGFAPIWGPFPDSLPFIPKSIELSKFTGFLHFVLSSVMALAILAHVAGALKHALLESDGTLTRMIPFKAGSFSELLDRDAGKTISERLPLPAAVLVLMIATGGAVVQHRISSTVVDVTQVETNSESSETSPSDDSGMPWLVDYPSSELGITILQLNSPVDGTFEKWDAQIDFDPDKLEESSVRVVVDVRSLKLGSVTDQAISADFLNTETFPEAVFEASDFTRTQTGYLAKGNLKLLEVTAPVELPFTLSISEDGADMSGTVVLNRLDFGVGAKGFKDESSVAFAVTVNVAVKATRAD